MSTIPSGPKKETLSKAVIPSKNDPLGAAKVFCYLERFLKKYQNLLR